MCLTNEQGNWVYLSKPILSCPIMGMTLFTIDQDTLSESCYKKNYPEKVIAISSISFSSILHRLFPIHVWL